MEKPCSYYDWEKISKNLKKSKKPNFDRKNCFAHLKPVRKRIDSSKSSPFKLRFKSMENDRVPLFWKIGFG
jgi:hypothetical protein